MKALAWLTMVLGGILARGSLLLFLDFFVTGIFSGNPYRYESMVVVLTFLGGTAYIAFRAFRFIRRPEESPVTASVR